MFGTPSFNRGGALSKGGGFNFAAWKAAQLGGFDFDYTKTDRNFQEANGPSPASAVDQLIRLSLSDRFWGGRPLEAYLAGQPELWNDAVVVFGPNSSRVGANDYRIFSPDGTDTAVNVGGALVIGRVYFVTFEMYDVVSGSIRVGNPNAPAFSTPGVKQFFLQTVETVALIKRNSACDIKIRNVSFKEVARAAATQGTASFAPRWDPSLGAKWDGNDDRHLTNIGASAGNNLLILRATFPGVITGSPILAGARGAQDTRFFLAIEGGAGRLAAGVGAQSTGMINAGPDLRGQTAIVGLANSGSQVRLFVNDTKVYEGAQSGVVEPTVPLAIGGFNDNGTPAVFFGGSTARVGLFHTNEFVDTDLFRRIAANY